MLVQALGFPADGVPVIRIEYQRGEEFGALDLGLTEAEILLDDLVQLVAQAKIGYYETPGGRATCARCGAVDEAPA